MRRTACRTGKQRSIERFQEAMNIPPGLIDQKCSVGPTWRAECKSRTMPNLATFGVEAHATLKTQTEFVQLGVNFTCTYCEINHLAASLTCYRRRANGLAWVRVVSTANNIVLSLPSWNGFTSKAIDVLDIGNKIVFDAASAAAPKTSIKIFLASCGPRLTPWVLYERIERPD